MGNGNGVLSLTLLHHHILDELTLTTTTSTALDHLTTMVSWPSLAIKGKADRSGQDQGSE